MKVYRRITNALLALSLAAGVSAYAARSPQQDDKKDKDKQEEQHKANDKKAAEQHKAAPALRQEPQARPAEQQRQEQQHQRDDQQRVQQEQQRQQEDQQRQQQRQQEDQQRQQQRQREDQQRRESREPQAQPPAAQPRPSAPERTPVPAQRVDDHRPSGPQRTDRLPEDRQRQLITQQQQRVVQYQQHLDQQQAVAQRYEAQLQQQHRLNEYRYEQAYWAREREQREALARQYNYANNPAFYSPPIYRYYRGGTYYQVNQYEADMINRSINTGYDQGYRMGMADRQDGWRGGYQNSFAYQDASYGWDGYSGDQGTYNYYFRQGFSRGYQDGFNGAFQYGAYNNGSYSILGNVLGAIFRLQSLR